MTLSGEDQQSRSNNGWISNGKRSSQGANVNICRFDFFDCQTEAKGVG